MNVFKYINDTFKDTPDLVERKIKYSFSCVHIYYIETICSSEQINNFVLKNLTNPNGPRRFKDILAGPNFKEIDLGRLEFYLYNGFQMEVFHILKMCLASMLFYCQQKRRYLVLPY